MPENHLIHSILTSIAGTSHRIAGSNLKTKVVSASAGVFLLVVLGVAVTFWSFNQMQETSEARKNTEVQHIPHGNFVANSDYTA